MRKIRNAILDFFRHGDLLLLTLCIITSIFGMVVISSATKYSESYRYLIIQGVALCMGMILYFLMTLLDVEILAEHRQAMAVFNVILVCMLLIWGVEGTSGQKNWLHFPGMPINIQPAEICKITFIIIIAKTMSIHQTHVSSVKSVGSIMLHLLLIVGVIFIISQDIGSALVFVFIFLIIAYIGGVRGWWFLGSFAVVGAIMPVVWKYLMADYQKNRILMFFDPRIDPTGEGIRWDTNRSIAMLSGGGVTGQGLYKGNMVQSHAIAAQHTDFIFSAVGEELGMIGCVVIMLLLAAIVARCIYVGVKTTSYMNRLICFGVAAMLAFQTLVNVGMCIGVFPVIGLTLPFISYGGSSMITLFLAVGLVSGIHMRPDPDASSYYVQYHG